MREWKKRWCRELSHTYVNPIFCNHADFQLKLLNHMGLDILMDHLCGDRVKQIGVEIIHRPTYVNPI